MDTVDLLECTDISNLPYVCLHLISMWRVGNIGSRVCRLLHKLEGEGENRGWKCIQMCIPEQTSVSTALLSTGCVFKWLVDSQLGLSEVYMLVGCFDHFWEGGAGKRTQELWKHNLKNPETLCRLFKSTQETGRQSRKLEMKRICIL